jgi:hypothetical protein
MGMKHLLIRFYHDGLNLFSGEAAGLDESDEDCTAPASQDDVLIAGKSAGFRSM